MTMPADRIAAALAWMDTYCAELDVQMIPPNGDDFNELEEGVRSILNGGVAPNIRITPDGR